MNVLAKISTIAAAVALTCHPCMAAAAATNGASVAATQAASPVRTNFDLNRHSARLNRPDAGAIASTSLTLAASQQTASEAEDQPRRRGPGTTTYLIIGGVLLLVLVAVAVASAAPTPGPEEGAFD